MGLLTKYVHDRSKLEANMAVGYNVDKALGFCIEYFKLYPHSKRRIWDNEEELRDARHSPEGASKKVLLTRNEVDQIHNYVISNSVYIVELLRCNYTTLKKIVLPYRC